MDSVPNATVMLSLGGNGVGALELARVELPLRVAALVFESLLIGFVFLDRPDRIMNGRHSKDAPLYGRATQAGISV